MKFKISTRAWISVILQIVAWGFFIGAPLYQNDQRPEFWKPDSLEKFIVLHGLLILFFYANYLYLIPKVLIHQGSLKYTFYLLASLTLLLALVNFNAWLMSLNFNRPFHFTRIAIVPIIQIYAASTAWRLLEDLIDRKISEKLLIRGKHDAELKFLRSQINPHFLFNTLNNINALIRNKPDEAERSVVRLSFLMRYMLNSGQKDKASLTEEVEYIENYIALQKLRLAKDFKIKFELIGETRSEKIEPLLLIGFIENTFKHGVSGEDSDFIEIKIVIRESKLVLITRNSIPKLVADKNLVSGIGLQNTLNRLELCYKNRYRLDTSRENNIYSTHLEIDL